MADPRSDAGPGAAPDVAPGPDSAPHSSKAELRRRLVAARAERPVTARLADDRARTGHVLAALRDVEPSVVAIYLSTSPHSARPEPGTVELATALWTLGHRILCPVLSPTPDGPRHDPSWAWFEGPRKLVPGLWGIPEPTAEPRGADALAQADLVICSCLAATRRGVRLGVGGGWYDRALQHRREGVETWALLADDEVLDALPREPHDVLVDRLVTPSGILACARD